MFDSGFGGLTVARALIDLLPGEDVTYIGDTGRYPYGPKPSADEVNLAAVCERARVRPSVLACPLPAAVGRVLRGGSDDETEFTLLATRWQELDLTPTQVAQLQQMAGQALLAM